MINISKIKWLLIAIPIIIIAISINLFSDQSERQDYLELSIKNKILNVDFYYYKGNKVPIVEFDFGTVELYCVDYNAIQVDDSLVKNKNEFKISLYRNAALIDTLGCNE